MAETTQDHSRDVLAHVRLSATSQEDPTVTGISLEKITSRDHGIRTVGGHAINRILDAKDELYSKFINLLELMKVPANLINPCRLANHAGDVFAPVTLMIGVYPKSLSCDDAYVAAFKTQELLVEHGITDVDVEFIEMIHWPDLSRMAPPVGKEG